MKVKKSAGDILFDVFNYLFMLLIVVIMLAPMIHVEIGRAHV